MGVCLPACDRVRVSVSVDTESSVITDVLHCVRSLILLAVTLDNNAVNTLPAEVFNSEQRCVLTCHVPWCAYHSCALRVAANAITHTPSRPFPGWSILLRTHWCFCQSTTTASVPCRAVCSRQTTCKCGVSVHRASLHRSHARPSRASRGRPHYRRCDTFLCCDTLLLPMSTLCARERPMSARLCRGERGGRGYPAWGTRIH